MQSLSKNGEYTIEPQMKDSLGDFYGNYCSEEETYAVIRDVYKNSGYVLDTHTAVASAVYGKYVAETKDTKKAVIASTASPYKFTRSVMNAIDAEKYDVMGDFELVDELSVISGVSVPNAIEEIRNAEIRHNTVCEAGEMKAVVKQFLGI